MVYSDHCPWRDVTEFAHHVYDLYTHYKAGFLLTDGGIVDQPQWYTAAMRECDRINNQIDAEQRREREEKQRRNEHRPTNSGSRT